jgi:hypothetical protein
MVRGRWPAEVSPRMIGRPAPLHSAPEWSGRLTTGWPDGQSTVSRATSANVDSAATSSTRRPPTSITVGGA